MPSNECHSQAPCLARPSRHCTIYCPGKQAHNAASCMQAAPAPCLMAACQ